MKAIPVARAMMDRKTREIVGPIARVFSDDWPYKHILDSEILWRYLRFYKFEDMLKTSSLYFTRPDRLFENDPLEGLLAPGNDEHVSKSDQTFRELYGIEEDTSKVGYHGIHRNVVFIQCWHRNTRESMRMWKEYTEDTSDSVVVTTSVKALKHFIPGRIVQGGVTYQDQDLPRTEWDHSALFFFKPKKFSHEREYRLLRQGEEGECFKSSDPNDSFRKIPVNLHRIIHRVVSHPRAKSVDKRNVEELMSKYLRGRKREDSLLGTAERNP